VLTLLNYWWKDKLKLLYYL